MADYVTDDGIVSYFKSFKSNFTLADIPPHVRRTALAMIHRRAGMKFIEESKTIYINGEGRNVVYITESHVKELHSVTLLNHQAKTSTALNIDMLDTNRHVFFDKSTGMLKLVKSVDGFTEQCWPDDFSNIEIVATFGIEDEDLLNLLETLQLMIMNDIMQRIDPKVYGKGDIVAEKIGKYQYEFYSKSQTKSVRKTLGQIVDDIFDMLPSNKHDIGAI